MSRARIPAIVLAVLLLPCSVSAAEELPPPGNLMAHTPWFRLEIVAGRIRLTRVRLGHEAKLVADVPEAKIEESLSFSASTANSARLTYQYRDASQQWTVDAEQSRQVTIDRLPSAGSEITSVRFRQPLDGNLVLVVEDGSEAQEAVGESFWHLQLTEPELCRKHLVPVLQALRPDWRLCEQADCIEAALWAAARQAKLPDTKRMRTLVGQLADPEFTRRQAADRELRALGYASVGFLQRLEERSLDVEQRTRIREIRRELEPHTGDTPVRIAARLIDDRKIWLTLLDREDEAQRLVAARHLQTLLGQPLAFDPVASPAERQTQLRRLRLDLGVDAPVLIGDAGGGLRR